MKTAIKIEDVLSVYSGINGRCCCGCAGTHRYASKHVKAASKHRGYAVEDDEVSDRSVKIIVNKINKRINEAKDLGDCVSLEAGNRLYVAYLRSKEAA